MTAERVPAVGTAGHIDHGKSALVDALTGTRTDRLPEEHRRGISIELGFAELPLADGRSVSLIDVPGHERLIRTMVAGATGIDLYLMVVAANDGPMPQTREHLQVLRALQIDRGVVAITKCDLVSAARREEAEAAVRRLMPEAPLVAVSAKTGTGIEQLRSAIGDAEAAASRSLQTLEMYREAHMHVDRVFSLPGTGTVATGTLRGGPISVGDRVTVLPGHREARVRGIHVHDKPVNSALPGQRTGLNLARLRRAQVARGDVIAAAPDTLDASFRLDVELDDAAMTFGLRGQRIQVHHATRDSPARGIMLGDRLAQLRLESPLIALAGDRVVLRSISPPGTIGGGRVIDPRPPRHGPSAVAEVRAISEAEPEALVAAAVKRVGELPADPRRWTTSPLVGPALSRFPEVRWRTAVDDLIETGDLASDDSFVRTGDPQQGADAEANPELLAALAHLERGGSRPPAPVHVANELGVAREEAIATLDKLVDAGRAVRLADGIYYTRESYEVVVETVVELMRMRGDTSIAEVRDALGTSRKYAQALLEHLNASGISIRRRDRHVLRGRT